MALRNLRKRRLNRQLYGEDVPCARCGTNCIGFAVLDGLRYCHGVDRSCYDAELRDRLDYNRHQYLSDMQPETTLQQMEDSWPSGTAW